MEGIMWTDIVINGEAFQKVKRERNVLQKRKANSIGQHLHGNCNIEAKIEERI
jgi:hypothetical protein